MDDTLLLRQFVHEGSDAAFEALMRRYAGLVYSAALRQTADPHLAEDITQAVFIVLSRKAPSLSPNVILSAWLLTTTRLTVINLRRRAAIRRRVEQTSATMAAEKIELPPQPGEWAAIAPLLDDCLAALNDTDRTAVVLRFFEQCSLADVGERLGISAGAAEKRVARAVEKLRRLFARRGVTVAGLLLATMLTQHAVQAAPAALAATLPAALVAANTTAQVSSAALAAKGALQFMAMTQAKQLALGAALFFLIAAAGGGFIYWMLPPRQPAVTSLVTENANDAPPPKIQPPEPQRRTVDEPQVTKAPGFAPPAPPPPPTPPQEIVPQPGINLLSRVDTNDAVNGKWRIENGELLSGQSSYARFEIPYEPPEEYDFHVNFTMLQPRDEVTMICAHAGKQFVWKFGSHGNQVLAIDNNGGEIPETRRILGNLFAAGQKYDLTVQVRNAIVAVYINNKVAGGIETDYRKYTLNAFWSLPHKNTLGVGTWGTAVRFHSIDIVEVTGKGRFLRAEGDPAPAKVVPPLPAEERWKDAVDLMPLIDAQRDGVAGTWIKGERGVSCSAGPTTRLEIPYDPPQEYDLKVVMSRDAGKEDLDLVLGRDGKSLSWMIGRDDSLTGFQLWSKSANYINNPTVERMTGGLVNGRQYAVVIQIRRNFFSAIVDGERISSYDNGEAFGLLKGWDLPTPGRIGIGSNQCRATFHSIQLLEVSGKGRPGAPNPNRVLGVTMDPAERRPNRLVDEEVPAPQQGAKPQKPPKAPAQDF